MNLIDALNGLNKTTYTELPDTTTATTQELIDILEAPVDLLELDSDDDFEYTEQVNDEVRARAAAGDETAAKWVDYMDATE